MGIDNNNDSGSDMKIGLRLPQTDEHRATKQNIMRLATQAENAGFDSLWVLERLIWPIKPQDPYPGSADGKFPADWEWCLQSHKQVFFLYDYYNTFETCLFDDMNNRILIFKITKKTNLAAQYQYKTISKK